MTDQPWMVAKKLGYDEIAKLLPVAFDQDFLLDILKSLNYDIDDKGVCFGFAHIVKHYVHSQQTQLLNEQLLILVDLYLTVRKKTLSETTLKQYENQHKYQKKFYHAISDAVTALQVGNTPAEKQLYYDLRALFDGIYLYQYHRNIYTNQKFSFSTSAAQDTLDILQAEHTEIEYRGQFSDVYKLTDIAEYLDQITKEIVIAGLMHPVSMVLNSNRHAYTIAYDPELQMWIYADAGCLPLISIHNLDELANKMLNSFSSSNVTIFNTTFYAAVSDRDKMTCFLANLRKNPEWQKLHTVTPEKIHIKAGKNHPGKWARIASGEDLQHIHQTKYDEKNYLVKPIQRFFGKTVDRVSLFVANHTYGKYPKHKVDGQTLPIYQTIRR